MIDVSDPTTPREVCCRYTTPGDACGVAVVGGIVYVADGDAGLRIVDLSGPATPREVGAYNAPGYTRAVAVVGSTAYVSSDFSNVSDFSNWRYGKLIIMDVSDPATPGVVGACHAGGYDVAVVGSTAYIAADAYEWGSSLRIVDVSDPTTPSEVSTYYTPGRAYGVAVVGSTAYIADGWGSGLRIVDVSDPTMPSSLGNCDTWGDARGVAVVGCIAYIAPAWGGLVIVDISDPTAPREVSAYNTPGSASDVAVVGNTAYIADGSAGLLIMDVSDPAAPRKVGNFDTPGGALAVAMVGSTAYVADGSGLLIVDVSDPTTPTELGAYHTPGSAEDVAVVGSTVYVADGSGGLLILRYVAPEPTITPTPSITPTPTATPTSTPFQLVSWQQEAEHGIIATPLAAKAGMGASACAYVYSEATSYAEPGVGSLSFEIQVPFFVSIDGGAPSIDPIPQIDGQWDWVWQQFDGNPITLTAGTHTLCFAGREADAHLDYVVLTNDPAFVPPDLPLCSAGPWLPLVIKSH